MLDSSTYDYKSYEVEMKKLHYLEKKYNMSKAAIVDDDSIPDGDMTYQVIIQDEKPECRLQVIFNICDKDEFSAWQKIGKRVLKLLKNQGKESEQLPF